MHGVNNITDIFLWLREIKKTVASREVFITALRVLDVFVRLISQSGAVNAVRLVG